jgi:acetyl-CoA synthetase
MIPQAVFTMLACARIGAVHSVVFAGFSDAALADRIVDGRSKVVVTADAGVRGGKAVPLKPSVDRAIALAAKEGHVVDTVLVTHRAGAGVGEGTENWKSGRDVDLDAAMKAARADNARCPPVVVGAEDPLFVLYTSGSTGKPKGVLHTTAGYAVYSRATFKYVFDVRASAGQLDASRPADVFFSSADVGWVTGHTYGVYGPLLCGAHSVIFEGIPTYPTPERLWQIVAKHRVTILYTAPTAIRALMKFGNEPVAKHDLSSLRLLGTVGEPIGEDAWRWYHRVVGGERCPIVDTYWQTETGAAVLTGLPGATDMKPGAATKPFFGIDAHVVKADGSPTPRGESGFLIFKQAWPGMARTVLNDHDRYKKTYFSDFPGFYFTGDAAMCVGYFSVL